MNEPHPQPLATWRPNPGALIGARNREAVRAWMASHIGATNREAGAALGLSAYAVGRHVARIRAEWTEQS
jgi:hypothetical protein